MGKKYYCDYCDISFIDNSESRKKHLEGIKHQNNVKIHYDYYKGSDDPVELLIENSKRPQCKKFNESRFCQFGLSCKYSHLPYGIDFNIIDPNAQNPHLLQQYYENNNNQNQNDKLSFKKNTKKKSSNKLMENKLPSGLPKNLPPSLKPPPKSGYNFSNCAQWG
ncbi:13009_t:CDS:2 [Entrophospora sp. SA101]|nr:12987_t:CDS:2 [Entrophospora sp. SA101]CAJ0823188.1 12993_t:CDS:2 [Entrophospora sp. SA101]CAJ0823217.1 13009_t:CDS:2 [Entrophospora sp. SA101]